MTKARTSSGVESLRSFFELSWGQVVTSFVLLVEGDGVDVVLCGATRHVGTESHVSRVGSWKKKNPVLRGGCGVIF